jgi:hypothetical protein
MRKDAGVRIEVVILLRDLEDVDIGIGDGAPWYDLTMGVDTDGVDARVLEGRDDGKGGRDKDWAGDGARGTVGYSVGLSHLMALDYSVELSIRSGVAYWDSPIRIVGIDDMD